ncbi:putative bifunctional diguanylate cyclase/phosphodiesterase [Saccharospirillum salsuginis]|uniref:EAL domain-containing protein n=1 Tax=Saccharospirillum salsuginis TaxID=418750 RepID=A0A918NC47_9GAMM|nr:EAL domain-containing protein [Saccharospirillum salsuginis]GGX56912.1 hypothetical protein GCM10007392_25480 [Saccharospirillum salsuginis]
MGKIHPIHLRATAQSADTDPNRLDLSHARVLLAVGSRGNRDRLRAHFQAQYDLVDPHQLTAEDGQFDLAIVDPSGYRRWHQAVLDAKLHEEPVFLPTILMVSRNELSLHLKSYGDLVDEFIVTPVDRLELSERVAMLLRARRMAQEQQAQLAYLTTHDRVTGLPNKPRFLDTLSDRIVDASVLNRTVQVVVLAFDFTPIMRSLGHHGLDRAAKTCSARLRALLAPDCTLARLTTDTWGLIPPPGQSMDALVEQCQRLQSVTDKPIPVNNERIHIDMTLGVGVYPDDATEALGALDCAINALSSATDSTPRFYSRAMQHRALRFIRTETRLRDAFGKNQFELWFQPQVSLADHQVHQVEALVRWRLPGGEVAPPNEFLPVARAANLTVPLDRWVLTTACATLRKWLDDGLNIDRMAVNITAEDVRCDDFVAFVRSQLVRFGLPPSVLELELTESTLMDANDDTLRKLSELRDLGLDIALDDFGTGYSSLSYLHTLPINILKIDQCFIRNILTVETDAAITRSILWLANNFRLNTIAEGVESREQADFLKALHVDMTQGYHYARPMPDPAFRQWLDRWRQGDSVAS